MDDVETNESGGDLPAARRATRSIFLVMGIATAAWAPMIPFVKTRLLLDDARLGLLLLGLGAGAIAAMPLSGFLIHRLGSRRVILVAGVLSSLTVVLPAVAPTTLLLAAVLVFFGAVLGGLDVATNAHAVAVERLSARPLMSGFHGLFSVGGLVGAAAMTALLKAGLPLQACAAAIAVALLALTLAEARFLLPRAAEGAGSVTGALSLPHGIVAVLGALAFIAFLAEGAVLDWSAVLLAFWRGFSAETAGMGYAAFSVAMATGRLLGDAITRRLGATAILRIGGLVAAAGFLIAVALPGATSALLGFVLVGLGASNIVPVLFSAAGRVPGTPPSVTVPAVATLGYAGLLAGPALIGFAAEFLTLPVALSGVAVLLLVVAASAPVAGR